MSKYIDLTEFSERIKKHIKPDNLEEKALIEWCIDECIRQGHCMPTADVVEVVRCKDCKHCFHRIRPNYEHYECTYEGCSDEVVDYVEPTHYCSHGERREE